MPDAKGNADDSDAEQQAENQVKNGNLPPSRQNPEEIHKHGQTSGLIGAVHQLMTKGPQCICAQFEELHAKRYADDGDAHQQPHQVIYQGDDDTAQQKPEYVAKSVHEAVIS